MVVFQATISIDAIISIISGAVTAIIAFFALRNSARALSYTSKSSEYTVKSFERARAIEEVALAEGILRDVRALTKEYAMVQAGGPADDDPGEEAYRFKLKVLLEKTFGALNWFALLVEIGQIQHPKLLDYFRGAVTKWYDELFVPNMRVEAADPKTFPQLKALYKKYKNESVSKKAEN